MPAKTINIQSLELKDFKEKPWNFCKEKLTKTKKMAMMIERMVVAKVESIPFNPILPKIATKAAVIEERKAKINHIFLLPSQFYQKIALLAISEASWPLDKNREFIMDYSY